MSEESTEGGERRKSTLPRRPSFIPSLNSSQQGGGLAFNGKCNGSRRRSSVWQMNLRRMSMYSTAKPPKEEPKLLEPTYRIDPDDSKRFNPERVSRDAQRCLEIHLKNEEYNATTCRALALNLSNAIKDRIRDMGFERYKIVTQVVIGQTGEQGVEMASRCIWGAEHDNFASATFCNDSLFAAALIFGIYFD